MEEKITALVKWMSLVLVLVNLTFVIDEFGAPKKSTAVVAKLQSEYEPLGSGKRYYLTFTSGLELEVNTALFHETHSGDIMWLLHTPVFNRLKSYAFENSRTNSVSIFGKSGVRLDYLIGSIIGVFLCVGGFVLQRFELRVSAFFFAFVLTAMYWWNLV